MRTAFMKALSRHARQNDKICLVVGDLGYSVVEGFAREFPGRFLNAGVAEQNMAGMAAGWSISERKTVFIYSIANFPTIRCLEQIRNDICYHCANVKIVAVGGGLAYGPQGYSHFGLEDLALLRALPGITVCAPADAFEADEVCGLACETSGPFYIRLSRDKEPFVHSSPISLKVGEAVTLRKGSDGTFMTTGSIAYEALVAADLLLQKGFRIRVISFPFVKPLDKDLIVSALAEAPWVLTIEEHCAYGGLGSAIAEVMAEKAAGIPLYRLCTPEVIHQVGHQEYLRKMFGVDAQSIVANAKDMIKNYGSGGKHFG